jgi:hypothetical protein
VMVLSPVISHEQHRHLPPPARPGEHGGDPVRPNGSVLDGTTSHQPYDLLTNQQGHDLTPGLDNQSSVSKCSPAGGSDTTLALTPTRCEPISVIDRASGTRGAVRRAN